MGNNMTTPAEKLKQIEDCYGEFGSQEDSVHKEWLILRVKQLEKALEFECGNWCHPEHNPCNALETLNTMPTEEK